MYRTDTEKLKAKIEEKEKTNQEIADTLGIDRATFYRRVKGNSLKISDVQKLSNLLELSGQEVTEIFLAE